MDLEQIIDRLITFSLTPNKITVDNIKRLMPNTEIILKNFNLDEQKRIFEVESLLREHLESFEETEAGLHMIGSSVVIVKKINELVKYLNDSSSG